MAEASISVFQDQFSCSICLDLLKDPVTINCGHSYCMSCITDCWNQEDQKRVYSCPQCRQTFTPRPALGKNVILAEMVEKLKRTKLHSDGAAPSYAGPEDVECDVCTGRKHKAVKSCLVCLNSYCQTHFERHEELQSGKRHKVTEATGRLQEMICSQHDRLLEIFCRTDQTCICYLCTMDEHKSHNTVSAAAERTEKQRLLKDNQRKHQQRIEEKEKKLQDLREAVKTHKRSAQTAVEDTERIFTELIRSIKSRSSEVIQLIRDQEKTAVSRAEGLLKELEQEIEDLRRRHDEMEQLSHTEHHISFLQSFQSLSASSGSTDNITVSSLLLFDDVGKSVSILKEKVEDFCKEEIEKISGKVSYIVIIPTNEPSTRMEFIQYSRKFSLDPNTAQKNLCLSEENRAAKYTDTEQQYPDHPDRFDDYYDVLCRESVCGRCYWEVEWSGENTEFVVSYKSISRKGKIDESRFGNNDQSWCLECSSTECSFWHNDMETKLPVVSSSCRIGVYVDHSAGILSFYSVSDTMTLIHRVHTTFTQPLYPGFGLDVTSMVRLI
ncbi:tripartite motif-containing protein 16-like protein [Triplophysa dalaica]|uniref:tripartite motif-containing protein 16-like protein n=1 Tax=Triplophysa dalaica TaxID=1582913 RepID=UPI0024DFF231|nr:tripartite motif-containing protein 16-like protein [Triplophysa dalaica]